MELRYDPTVDAASVDVRGPVAPGARDGTERLDADRLVHYDEDGQVNEYEFLNVRRFGVRLDDLEHRAELSQLFRAAGFAERTWSTPVGVRVERRRERPTG